MSRSEKKTSEQEIHPIEAPRIQIVLNQVGQETYEAWLVLNVPGGKPPHTTRISGPLGREEAARKILDIYTTLGNRYAFGDAEPDIPEIH